MRPILAIFVIVVVCISMVACAQMNYAVKQSYVYWQVIFPGNTPGQAPSQSKSTLIDTTTIIYVELNARVTPVWNKAWRNGIGYAINVTSVLGDSFNVGKARNTVKPIVIKHLTGNRLWLVQFTAKLSTNAMFDKKTTEGQIILEDTLQHKQTILNDTNATELLPQLRP